MDSKLVYLLALLVAAVSAAPSHLLAAPLAYPAPAPLVTATSSQVVARNYNGLAPIAAPLVSAPIAAPAAPYLAPYAAAPYAAAPYAAAPYAAAPYAAAPYVAAPYAHPYAYSASYVF